jgi:hypothetical protein
MYTQQHLPKYLSYFIVRYLENVSNGKNIGGWYDPYECTYNYSSYAQQAYLTLLAKAGELMMFSLGSLLSPDYSLCIPINGQIFREMDKYLGKLGQATGVATYLPFHSQGEDYLHNYLGMIGIPFEPTAHYPEGASKVFLTQGATRDKDIIKKIKTSLLNGSDVIVTSGFLKAAQDLGFNKELANVVYTDRKALINTYAYSDNGGVSFGGREESSKHIMVPQLEYMTNDTWELAAGFGEDNSFPLLLKTQYGKGRLFILTVPEDYGDLYNYPKKILYLIREVFNNNWPVMLDAVSKLAIFTYDNDCFVLHSFQPWYDEARLELREGFNGLEDLVSGQKYSTRTEGDKQVVRLRISPGVNYVFKAISE